MSQNRPKHKPKSGHVQALEQQVKALKQDIARVKPKMQQAPRPTPLKIKEVDRKEYSAISKAISLPGEYPPIRWCGLYTDVPTALARPWDQVDVPFLGSVTPTAYKALPADAGMVVLFRRAECATITYDANPLEKEVLYQMKGLDRATIGGTQPSNSWSINTEAIRDADRSYLHMPVAYAQNVTDDSWLPHGTVWFAAADEDGSQRRFFWLDGGGSTGTGAHVETSFTRSLTGSTQSFMLLIDRWTPQGLQEAVFAIQVAFPVGAATAVNTGIITESGYYCFSLTPDSPPTGSKGQSDLNNNTSSETMNTKFGKSKILKNPESSYSGDMKDLGSPVPSTITVDYFRVRLTGISCFGHKCIPGFEAECLSMDNYRVNGAAVMFTNTSSTLNEQGKVSGVQAPRGKFWYDYTASYAQVAGAPGSMRGVAKKGLYGFMKPSGDEDTQLRTYTESNGLVVMDSFWPLALEDQPAYLVIRASIDDASGQDGYFTYWWGIEWGTTNKWRNSVIPGGDPLTTMNVLRELKKLPQWHENPLHIKDILTGLKNVARTAGRMFFQHAPTIMGIADTLANIP